MTLEKIYNLQIENQEKMLKSGTYDSFKMPSTEMLPADDIKLFSYHVQQLISEVGEVLEADKRWKNIRNNKYNQYEKLEEIADCFIVLMNIAMYSNIYADDLEDMILTKLNIVRQRINDNNS